MYHHVSHAYIKKKQQSSIAHRLTRCYKTHVRTGNESYDWSEMVRICFDMFWHEKPTWPLTTTICKWCYFNCFLDWNSKLMNQVNVDLQVFKRVVMVIVVVSATATAPTRILCNTKRSDWCTYMTHCITFYILLCYYSSEISVSFWDDATAVIVVRHPPIWTHPQDQGTKHPKGGFAMGLEGEYIMYGPTFRISLDP